MKTPNDVIEQWMQGVNTADVELLLSLYDDKAVLIPTFSNRILNTPEKLRDYFERLGAREGLSIVLHDKTLSEQSITDALFIISGLYNWRFTVDDELLNFEARFSYVLDMSKKSPIMHHHSSQIPRML